ncbi:hypothetical protein KFL_000940220 [Klebsormidium nitens]|uniref:Sulphur transport domain-containing protein n=1 Tax=Klebsormidium nitens TaxID=105231 RepID=A0A1Y1HUU3_KLENI|nr:hypothetical protein KFL_000940220 [Klebsormidium nitens]|eukprot:GAQ81913.1 hypothetical protein KFL_000940220 [Klebsormidium nitens]
MATCTIASVCSQGLSFQKPRLWRSSPASLHPLPHIPFRCLPPTGKSGGPLPFLGSRFNLERGRKKAPAKNQKKQGKCARRPVAMVRISGDFSPGASMVGGLLLGIATSLHLALNGRITGASGIIRGAFFGDAGATWKRAFLGGVGVAAVAWELLQPQVYGSLPYKGLVPAVLAGMLVGAGTKLANGCTSGHGVCGLPRLSPRSFVAVATFMATGAATAIAATRTNGFGLGDKVAVAHEKWPIITAIYGAASLAVPAAVLAPALTERARRSGAENKKEKEPSTAEPPASSGEGGATRRKGARAESESASAEAYKVPGGRTGPSGETPETLFVSFVCGLLFGTALAVGRMTNPAKVINFLNVAAAWDKRQGGWDPSLGLLMCAAVLFNLISFNLILKMPRPLLRDKFDVPQNKQIDAKLVVGSALFGVGWALYGVCPGPGFMNVGTGRVSFLAWFAALLGGTLVAMKLVK